MIRKDFDVTLRTGHLYTFHLSSELYLLGRNYLQL